ncbi:hypothetical protein [Chitinophaga nivalis]|uniref:DUF4595 domain-containing protein n=1 Tax=Chitinophaga nivalis TaxID=2991709 RepID=A0ABT3ILT3_9BACT|nr:hypothetical protein [Chitinophaga nivalis]MCW3465370.1 hypothetical protein [Chitinophaga nivalis]MCW3484938.1 hypothetical protein [Chitinophaga nivalis]
MKKMLLRTIAFTMLLTACKKDNNSTDNNGNGTNPTLPKPTDDWYLHKVSNDNGDTSTYYYTRDRILYLMENTGIAGYAGYLINYEANLPAKVYYRKSAIEPAPGMLKQSYTYENGDLVKVVTYVTPDPASPGEIAGYDSLEYQQHRITKAYRLGPSGGSPIAERLYTWQEDDVISMQEAIAINDKLTPVSTTTYTYNNRPNAKKALSLLFFFQRSINPEILAAHELVKKVQTLADGQVKETITWAKSYDPQKLPVTDTAVSITATGSSKNISTYKYLNLKK